MIRQGHLIAVVVRAFVIGCVVLLMVGCAGVRSEATNQEQGRSPEATASEATASQEEARCEGTRKVNVNLPARFTTNDLPGCPEGGLLLGTDKGDDLLAGEKGDDEIRGLGGGDDVMGGPGNDVIYGGPGDDRPLVGYDGDDVIYGGAGNDSLAGLDGDDVIYSGPGNDSLSGQGGNDVLYGGPGDDKRLNGGGLGSNDGQRDELYCGEGRDTYYAESIDYVSSSCEVKLGKSAPGSSGPPLCTKEGEPPPPSDTCTSRKAK